ncbi:MAG: LamG-like jellyroll fold domain-containing protein [Kiritimatiellia bacterium]|jgi:hypothetical protein
MIPKFRWMARFSRFLPLCLAAATVSPAAARTLALWPLEYNAEAGALDGRSQIDTVFDLAPCTTKADLAYERATVGWGLPPNPDATARMFDSANETAPAAAGTEYGYYFSGVSADFTGVFAQTNAFTLEGWCRLDTPPERGEWMVVAYFNVAAATGGDGVPRPSCTWIWSIRHNSKDAGGNYLYSFEFYDSLSNMDRKFAAYSEADFSEMFTGAWHHIALAGRLGGSFTMYLDGVAVGTVVSGGYGAGANLPTAAGAFRLGGRGDGKAFRGAMDYWRLSDASLGPASLLCGAPGSGLVGAACRNPPSTTVAYWTMGHADGVFDVADHVGAADLGKFVLNSSRFVSAMLPEPDDTALPTGQPPNGAAALSSSKTGCASAQTPGAALVAPGLGSALTPASSFTVEGWYRPEQEEGFSASASNASGRLFATRDPAYGWSLIITNGGHGVRSFRIAAADDSGEGLADGAFPGGAFGLGATGWMHLALVYDATAGNGAWTLYKDGEHCGSVSNTRAPLLAGGLAATNAYLAGTSVFGGKYPSYPAFTGTTGDAGDQVYGHFDCWRACASALAPAQFLNASSGSAAAALAYWPLGVRNRLFLSGASETGNYAFSTDDSITRLAHCSNTGSSDAPTVTNPDATPAFRGDSAVTTGSTILCTGGGNGATGGFWTGDRAVCSLLGSRYDPWTVEFYLKRASAMRDWEILIYGDLYNNDGAGSIPFALTSRKAGFRLSADTTGTMDVLFPGTADLIADTDAWHHLALTHRRKGSSLDVITELYLDGALAGALTQRTYRASTFSGIGIGSRPSGNALWGALGPIRVSRAALEPSQFLCAPPEAPVLSESTELATLAYWEFDDDAGAAGLSSAVTSGYALVDESGVASGSSAPLVARVPNADATAGFDGDAARNDGSVAFASAGALRAPYLGNRLDPGTSFTVEGWLLWNGATGSAPLTLFGTWSDSRLGGWRLLLDATGEAPCVRIFAKSPFSWSGIVADGAFTADPAPWADACTHIALARDASAGTWTLYVNGRPSGSVADCLAPTGRAWALGSFAIGAPATGTDAPGFVGSIDEWRVSRGALAAEGLLYRPSPATVVIVR